MNGWANRETWLFTLHFPDWRMENEKLLQDIMEEDEETDNTVKMKNAIKSLLREDVEQLSMLFEDIIYHAKQQRPSPQYKQSIDFIYDITNCDTNNININELTEYYFNDAQ